MWQIVDESIKSVNHPQNQDGRRYYISKDKMQVIVAVADGHGSKKCFRSDVGSKIAVVVLRQFLFKHLNRKTFDNWQSHFYGGYPAMAKKIHQQWLEKVKNHLESCPFTLEEQLIDPMVLNNPTISYGTTLLGMLITPNYIIYLQLGDGDILAVNDNAVKHPIEKDENLIANDTYSLCDTEAYVHFKFHYQSISGNSPDLIQLSTDGYSNSFPNDNEFQKTAIDYYNLYREEGIDFIKKNITEWLTETTVKGSGDDLTAIIVIKTIENESTIKRGANIAN